MPHIADIVNDIYYGRWSLFPAALGSNGGLKTEQQLLSADITVTTTGTAGAATGSAASAALVGTLVYVRIDYHASAPVTTVVTLTDAKGMSIGFVASKTDALWYPLKQACDEAGALITGVYVPHVLTGAVTATVTLSDALTGAVVVTLGYK